ncbi:hypothetical protein BBKW_1521 [Bifidobacterium catenulatum subsp. kashiwanohense JCM 15439 = DSM 21854]|nr:hypothetical protein BBKW_1521 [Bifidobacterium catenulatum subsp. kashiwanohense JCM 15439 = DSM 21854]
MFLRCHSTPLWQDLAKYGKSEKHPDKCDASGIRINARCDHAWRTLELATQQYK